MSKFNGLQKTHVLVTLGVLFTAGGALRLIPMNKAAAEETPTQSASEAPVGGATQTRGSESGFDPGEVCFSGEAAELILQDRRNAESLQIELRETRAELAQWERDLEAQAADLEALSTSLEARWEALRATADEDLLHLAGMYAAMRSDDAADIFNQMDPGFSAGFLRLMPSDQAGLILAAMEAETAYMVSLRIATMNQDIRSVQPTD